MQLQNKNLFINNMQMYKISRRGQKQARVMRFTNSILKAR